ncbi:MAG: M12 family metallo-peptidase [Planctomycetota bacterium]|jgi:hypothetical protein
MHANPRADTSHRGTRQCSTLTSIATALGVLIGLAGPVPAAAAQAAPIGGPGLSPNTTQADALVLDAIGLRDGTRQVLDLPDAVIAELAVPVVLEGELVTLRLRPHAVRSPHFQLLVAGADGLPQPVPAPASAVVRGSVEEWPGSIVTGTLRAGRLRALVQPAARGAALDTYAIEPLSASGEHLVYRASDLTAEGRFCGVEDVVSAQAADVGVIPGDLDVVPAMTCDVAVDADVQFYQDMGSSVDAVIDHVENVMAGCSVLYEDFFGVDLAVVAIIVRTAEPDPYFGNDGSTTLDQLGEHWATFQTEYDPDVVQLFTGKNYAGIVGLGSMFGVCHETNNVSLVEPLYYSSLVLQVRVSAHEFGHNFGANHCSSEPDCGIMCPAVCGPAASFGKLTTQTILHMKLTSSCLALAEELALPEIHSIAPESFPSAATAGFFTLNGSGLVTTFAVEVGDDVKDGFFVMVLNDETIMVHAPTPATLGPVPVVVHTAAGRSNQGTLVYGPNDPPILHAPFSASVGGPVEWLYGGDLGHVSVLLLSPSGITATMKGLPVLAGAEIATIVPLNPAALGRWKLPAVPASLAGLILYSQVVMFDGATLDAVSVVRKTNIQP